MAERREQGRSGLFRRARHLGDPALAAGPLPLRGGHLHRRPRPGRGARAGARQGRADGRDADLHRGPARGVRARLRLPDVPRQRALRGRLPARHLDRPAADRQAPGRDRRTRSAPTPSPTAPPARATTRSASSSAPTRSTRTIKVIAPWREWDLELARQADRVRRARARSRSRAARAASRPTRPTPTSCTSPTRAARSRIPGASPTPTMFTAAPWRPRTRPTQPTYVEIEFERGDPVARRRRARCRRPACSRRLNELAGANGIGRARPGREPLRRHEVARRLRDAGRHRAARGAPRDRVASRSTAARRTSRTS